MHSSNVGISKYFDIHWVTAVQTKYVKEWLSTTYQKGFEMLPKFYLRYFYL